MVKLISYIGSKVKLYDFLNENIFNNDSFKNKKYNFFDLFAGTNSVSHYVKNNTDWNVYGNDLSLYSHKLFSFLYFDRLNKTQLKIIKDKLEILSNMDLISTGIFFNEFSYNGSVTTIDKDKFSDVFGNQPIESRMFFSEIVGKRIDTIRSQIIQWQKSGEIKDNIITDILLTFLIHYVDKNSNTASVYGAYLKNTKKMTMETPFLSQDLLKLLSVNTSDNTQVINSTNLPVSDSLEEYKINNTNKKDNIIYLDPPYSTRSYESNYHILEYISDFNFDISYIKHNSKTAQRNVKNTNPFASKAKTFPIFEEMITKSLELGNNVFISYSTDGLMQQSDIDMIFSDLKKVHSNLILNIYTKSYKRFKSANTELKKLQEKLNNLSNMKNKTDDILNEITVINQELREYVKPEAEENELQEILWHFQIKE